MTAGSADPPRRKHLDMFRGIAAERLTRLNLLWVQLEQGLAGPSAIGELLRELHTLKGEAGLLGFATLAAVTHGLEDLLRPQAQGSAADAATGDLVLRGLDLISAAVAEPTDVPEDAAAEFAAALRQHRPAAAGDPDPTARPARPAEEAVRISVQPRSDSVRVTAAKLDRMRDLIGELMLTRSRLELLAREFRKARETAREYQESLAATAGPAVHMFRLLVDAVTDIEARLRDDTHRVADLVAELDGAARELRMVPIRTLFEQYPVAVRELARALGRQVRLVFAGEAVEVDRAVLERLSEPLLHLLRNAIDHGIETPALRRQIGKPEEGTVRVHAALRGRLLELVVEDDGAGVDVEAVRARAVELGLLAAAQAPEATDAQVLRTLFHANVSTRRQITQVSGRGLGLHVVQTSIEGLGGSVTVHSKRGGGAAFHLTVPVTLAMTSVVLFSLGQSRYALPAAAVVGLVAASACPPVASTAGPAVRYNGRVVPLLRLDEALAEPTQPTPTSGSERLMIVSRGRDLLALSGTSHHSEREVVLKSSGRFFARNRLVTAAVPMADGSLALVLSVAGIPTRAAGAGRPPHAAPTRQQTVLVADDSPVVRDLLAEALRAHGLRVLEASDGHEALQQLDAEPQIDLVVTDVDMPRLDGIGLLQQIRHRGGPRRLPVVIVSMRGSDQDQRRALSAGADAYLVKTDLSHAGLWSMLARFLS